MLTSPFSSPRHVGLLAVLLLTILVIVSSPTTPTAYASLISNSRGGRKPKTTNSTWPSPPVAWRSAIPLFDASTRTFGDPLLMEQSPLSPPRLIVYSSSTDPNIRNETQLHVIDANNGELLRSIDVLSGIGPYSGWCSADPVDATLCYCGTDSGVIAVNVAAMVVVWEYRNSSWIDAGFAAPIHPTAVLQNRSNQNGGTAVVVFAVFENGVNGSSLFVIQPFTSPGNELIFEEVGTVAFTMVWSVPFTNAVVYGRYHISAVSGTEVVEIVSREVDYPFNTVFVKGGYTYAPPGLWNNPNLDVDKEGKTIFVYTKPRIGYRNIQQLDSKTGEVLWELPTFGPVPDYDTFAFQNKFYRMVTDPEHNTTTTLIQAYNCTAGSDVPMFTLPFPTSDDNAILLIGHQGGGYVFGLNTNAIFFSNAAAITTTTKTSSSTALSSSSTTTASDQDYILSSWEYNVDGPSTGTTDKDEAFLYFGSTNGTYYAIRQKVQEGSPAAGRH